MKRLLTEKGAMYFTESVALKVVSLLLALILWITILGFKHEEIKKNVKLEPLIPLGMMITNKIPAYVQFTLSGPRVLLKDVEKKIQPIRPDLRRTRESTIGFAVSEDLIGELPSGVRVVGFFPANVLIRLEEIIERYVDVKPTFRGNPAEGYEISSFKVFPSKVAVSGPKSLLLALEYIGTEAFDIQDLKGVKEGIVSAEVDTNQGLQLSRDKVVRVRVSTKKVVRTEKMEE